MHNTATSTTTTLPALAPGVIVEVTTPYDDVFGTLYAPEGPQQGSKVRVKRGRRGTVVAVHSYPRLAFSEADVSYRDLHVLGDDIVLRMQVDTGERPGPGGVQVSADQSDPQTIKFNCVPA